jgi:hypothetical protein
MQLRFLFLSAFMIAFGFPALAQAEPAALIDFNNSDDRAIGTVMWRTEKVKIADGQDDLAIRADVEIPAPKLKLSMVLRRNLDPSVPASHLIDLTFTAPSDFIDGSRLGDVFAVSLGPKEMSTAGYTLLGWSSKTRGEGRYIEGLSEKPVDICENLTALIDNAWLAVYLNGAKRKPGTLRATVSDQSLWFSKGETGQQIFDTVLAAWEKAPQPGARNAVCHPS